MVAYQNSKSAHIFFLIHSMGHPCKSFKNDQIVATSYRVIILLQPAQEWWDRSGFSWDKAYYDSATYREVAANTLVILALTNKKN